MSDQRRGTDFESLRSLSADRSREAEDPLAELARLVSQSEPVRGRPGVVEPRQAYASEPRFSEPRAPEPRAPEPRLPEPPRAAFTPPAVEPPQDRLDPLGFRSDRFAAPSHPRSYGAPMPATHVQDDDFFADDPPSLRGAQPAGFASYPDDEDLSSGYDAYPRTYSSDFDDEDSSAIYPGAGEDVDDLPVRKRGGLLKAGAMLGVALAAGFGAWTYVTMDSGGDANGAPPVITAQNDPVKVVPEARPVEQKKETYDRIPVNADASVGPGPEEPGEKPRVILPNTPAPAAALDERPSETAETGSIDAPPAAETAPDGSPSMSPSGARVVKTIPIRPDGMPAAPVETAPQEPPAPIQGTGIAEGMSLQPTRDFGIMAAEAPPAQAETAPAQSQATAFAAEVPLPQPRPDIVQAGPAPQATTPQATTPQAMAPQVAAPTSSAGGPPSSPQPQVTVTNKRTLRPQGAPPPARTNSARPAQPRQQVAMASQAGAPATIAASAPIAAPQVAAIASASGSYGVQLTAQRSEQEALAAFAALKQRYPQVLGPYNATVARADLGPDRGVFYRALVPAQSQADASNMCIQFKAAGVDCIVQRR